MRALVTLFITAALASGPTAPATAQSEGMPRPSRGCDAPLVQPGDYDGTLEMEDGSDDYWVVVPEGYAEDAPVPLVLWLSNGDGSADTNYAGWRPSLDGLDVLFAIAGTRYRSVPDAMLALLDQLEAEFASTHAAST